MMRGPVEEEDRHRGAMGTGKQRQCRSQAELAADLESDWRAVQVDAIDGGGVGLVGA